MFNKISPCLTQPSALIIFKSIVLPFIEFGNALLLRCNKIDLNKIQRAQNRGLKIALGRGRRYRTNLLHADARLAEWSPDSIKQTDV